MTLQQLRDRLATRDSSLNFDTDSRGIDHERGWQGNSGEFAPKGRGQVGTGSSGPGTESGPTQGVMHGIAQPDVAAQLKPMWEQAKDSVARADVAKASGINDDQHPIYDRQTGQAPSPPTPDDGGAIPSGFGGEGDQTNIKQHAIPVDQDVQNTAQGMAIPYHKDHFPALKDAYERAAESHGHKISDWRIAGEHAYPNVQPPPSSENQGSIHAAAQGEHAKNTMGGNGHQMGINDYMSKHALSHDEAKARYLQENHQAIARGEKPHADALTIDPELKSKLQMREHEDGAKAKEEYEKQQQNAHGNIPPTTTAPNQPNPASNPQGQNPAALQEQIEDSSGPSRPTALNQKESDDVPNDQTVLGKQVPTSNQHPSVNPEGTANVGVSTNMQAGPVPNQQAIPNTESTTQTDPLPALQNNADAQSSGLAPENKGFAPPPQQPAAQSGVNPIQQNSASSEQLPATQPEANAGENESAAQIPDGEPPTPQQQGVAESQQNVREQNTPDVRQEQSNEPPEPEQITEPTQSPDNRATPPIEAGVGDSLEQNPPEQPSQYPQTPVGGLIRRMDTLRPPIRTASSPTESPTEPQEADDQRRERIVARRKAEKANPQVAQVAEPPAIQPEKPIDALKHRMASTTPNRESAPINKPDATQVVPPISQPNKRGQIPLRKASSTPRPSQPMTPERRKFLDDKIREYKSQGLETSSAVARAHMDWDKHPAASAAPSSAPVTTKVEPKQAETPVVETPKAEPAKVTPPATTVTPKAEAPKAAPTQPAEPPKQSTIPTLGQPQAPKREFTPRKIGNAYNRATSGQPQEVKPSDELPDGPVSNEQDVGQGGEVGAKDTVGPSPIEGGNPWSSDPHVDSALSKLDAEIPKDEDNVDRQAFNLLAEQHGEQQSDATKPNLYEEALHGDKVAARAVAMAKKAAIYYKQTPYIEPKGQPSNEPGSGSAVVNKEIADRKAASKPEVVKLPHKQPESPKPQAAAPAKTPIATLKDKIDTNRATKGESVKPEQAKESGWVPYEDKSYKSDAEAKLTANRLNRRSQNGDKFAAQANPDGTHGIVRKLAKPAAPKAPKYTSEQQDNIRRNQPNAEGVAPERATESQSSAGRSDVDEEDEPDTHNGDHDEVAAMEAKRNKIIDKDFGWDRSGETSEEAVMRQRREERAKERESNNEPIRDESPKVEAKENLPPHTDAYEDAHKLNIPIRKESSDKLENLAALDRRIIDPIYDNNKGKLSTNELFRHYSELRGGIRPETWMNKEEFQKDSPQRQGRFLSHLDSIGKTFNKNVDAIDELGHHDVASFYRKHGPVVAKELAEHYLGKPDQSKTKGIDELIKRAESHGNGQAVQELKSFRDYHSGEYAKSAKPISKGESPNGAPKGYPPMEGIASKQNSTAEKTGPTAESPNDFHKHSLHANVLDDLEKRLAGSDNPRAKGLSPSIRKLSDQLNSASKGKKIDWREVTDSLEHVFQKYEGKNLDEVDRKAVEDATRSLYDQSSRNEQQAAHDRLKYVEQTDYGRTRGMLKDFAKTLPEPIAQSMAGKESTEKSSKAEPIADVKKKMEANKKIKQHAQEGTARAKDAENNKVRGEYKQAAGQYDRAAGEHFRASYEAEDAGDSQKQKWHERKGAEYVKKAQEMHEKHRTEEAKKEEEYKKRSKGSGSNDSGGRRRIGEPETLSPEESLKVLGLDKMPSNIDELKKAYRKKIKENRKAFEQYKDESDKPNQELHDLATKINRAHDSLVGKFNYSTEMIAFSFYDDPDVRHHLDIAAIKEMMRKSREARGIVFSR